MNTSISCAIALAVLALVATPRTLPHERPFVSEPTIIEDPAGRPTLPTDVNNAGTVVGFINTTHPEVTSRAFKWSRRVGITELPLPVETPFSFASAINDCGEIVGETVFPGSDSSHAALWRPNGEVEDLGTLGGTSAAFAINERGIVVGASNTNDGRSLAFIWSESEGMRVLGTLGFNSVARSINNRNEVVGSSALDITGSPTHAFYWSRARGMIDIGTLNHEESDASAINDHGVAVGSAFSGHGLVSTAFRWTRAGGMRRLGGLVSDKALAGDINRRGLIVGAARDSNGIFRAILWTRPQRAFSIDPDLGMSSNAGSLNDRGLVAGDTIFEGDANNFRAVVWRIRFTGANGRGNPTRWCRHRGLP